MTELQILSVDDVLNKNDVRYENVPVPEWGGAVRIASLSAGDIIEWMDINNEGERGRQGGLHLILRAWVDAEGKRIGSVAHLEGLRKKDAQATGRLVNAIMEMNGLSKRAAAERKNDLSEVVAASSPTTSPVK